MYKRNNSIVETSKIFLEISKIVCVTTQNHQGRNVVLGNSFEVLRNRPLCNINNISSSYYLHSVRKTNNVVTCFPQNIINKCIYIPSDEESYIVGLINKVETE